MSSFHHSKKKSVYGSSYSDTDVILAEQSRSPKFFQQQNDTTGNTTEHANSSKHSRHQFLPNIKQHVDNVCLLAILNQIQACGGESTILYHLHKAQNIRCKDVTVVNTDRHGISQECWPNLSPTWLVPGLSWEVPFSIKFLTRPIDRHKSFGV